MFYALVIFIPSGISYILVNRVFWFKDKRRLADCLRSHDPDLQLNREMIYGQTLPSFLSKIDYLLPWKLRILNEESIEQRLLYAGKPCSINLDQYVALKNLTGYLGLIMAIILWFNPAGLIFYPLFFLGGFFMPDLWLRALSNKRKLEIDRQLPEVVDLLLVLMTGGLNLNLALHRTAKSMSGLVGRELRLTLAEIEWGLPRATALNNLTERHSSEMLDRFIATIIQSERYGSPLVKALHVLSKEGRDAYNRKVKERAQKVPVKMLFPLVFLILPSFLVLTVGPLVIVLNI